jgi:RNA polymerase sigma-70 factor (ECF subfamily)
MTESFDNSRSPIGSTSSSFLDRVKARDVEAWRRLARVYASLVLHWCRCKGVERGEDCEDICQEVFRAVVAKIDGFQRDLKSGSFRGWLWTITCRKVVDHFRRENRQLPRKATGGSDAYEKISAIPDDDGSSSPEASNEEEAIIIRNLCNLIRPEFEDRTWQAFWRSVVDGRPSAVVAEELGMTSGAVRQAKSRVLARLREAWKQVHGLEGDGFLGSS